MTQIIECKTHCIIVEKTSPYTVHSNMAVNILKHLEQGVSCLDTRQMKLYNKYHLPYSTHIDESCLEDRLFELPPKDNDKIFVLIPHSNISSKILKDHGWTNFVEYSFNENEWKLLSSKLKQDNDRYYPMFHPCPLLKSHIDTIEKILLDNNGDDKDNKNKILSACDIGCGSGRDDIWLCLRENVKWNIECVDFNYKMLNRLTQFAINTKVNNQISITKSKIRGDGKITLYKDINDDSPFLIYDLNQNKNEEKQENEDIDKYYFTNTYDFVLSVRFLERSIIYNLWNKGGMLKKNGLLLIYTFLEGAEKTKIGHPKNPNRLLKRGELSKVFDNKKMFKILVDKEMKAEGDRPIQCFLVQRL